MIKFLRNKKVQKRIYLILAIVILPPFLFWGVSISEKGTKSSSWLGTIDNHKISVQDYLGSYRAVGRQIDLMYGQLAGQIRSKINLKGEAWDRILLLEHAKKEKIKTTDTEVVDWLMEQPLFVRNGKFDTDFYKRYVTEYLHSGTREFEEEWRDSLTIQKIRKQISDKAAVTDEEIKTLYNEEFGSYEIAYGVIPWESQKSEIEVTDKDIESIYGILKNQLTAPEKAKIQYLFIPKESFESSKAVFDEKTATLEELSKKYGFVLKETEFFSKNEVISGIGFVSQISSLSFSLPLNKESDWIYLNQGSYRIKVIAKQAERPLSLEEAKSQVKEILLKQKATEAAIKKLNEFRSKIGGSDLDKMLSDAGVETKRIEKLEKNSTLPMIGPSAPVESIIQKMKEGEISEAFGVSTGAAMVKVLKRLNADEKKFEEEKEKLRRRLLDKKITEDMQKILEDLRKKLTMNLELMKQIFSNTDDESHPATQEN